MTATTLPVSLRTHSWYSLMEGVSSPGELLAAAEAQGYGAVALTDYNSLAGVVEFVEAAKQHGVRPIVGGRVRCGSQAATVLVAEPAGYANLCRLLTRIHLHQGNVKLSLALLLAEHGQGLHVLIDDPNQLKPPLTDALRGRVWAELVRPPRTEQADKALIEAAALARVKPVASLGAHFARKEGYRLHRLVTAVRQGITLDQVPQKLAVTSAHHLTEPGELRERYRDMPNALTNASALAEMCRSDVLPRGLVQPPSRLPPGLAALDHLRALCEKALMRRPPQDVLAARKRLEVELSLIADRDLAAYFLCAGELGEESRRQCWPLALRGSAAASLVLYLLGLSDADPVACGLRVERFLHAGRADLPDIDIECADGQRKAVFRWLLERHGRDHLARVGSVHHFRARSALKAAAMANGLGEVQAGELVASLNLEGDDALNDERLTLAPASWSLEPNGWGKVLAAAKALDGRPRELSFHPSGIVLSAAVIDDLCPSEKGPDGVRVSQYDGEAIERVGLVKLDLLSSHALTAISAARQHLQALDPASASQGAEDGDAAVAALLGSADTLGIGQLETPLARRLLRQVAPRNLADLMCCLAVARPGAASAGGRDAYIRRRHGEEPPSYFDPSLEPVLRDSLGVLLFEDDALSAIEAMTGLPATEADRLRRLLASEETAARAATEFLAACERVSTPQTAAEQALPHLLKFSAYAFCKAHACTTARIAWSEAWLKARHPLAFWAALLNRHGESTNYALWSYVEDAKRSGVEVLGPCVNRSRSEWTQEVTALRAGLCSIQALGATALSALLEERDKAGSFSTLAEFRRRLTGQIQPLDMAVLIRAGAFDSFGRGREVALREAEASRIRLRTRPGAEPWPLDGVDTSPFAARRKEEWDLLGFLPGPPIMVLARRFLPCDLADSRALPSLVGRKARLVGLVAHCQEGTESRPAGALTLLDEFGLIEVILPAGVEAPNEADLVLVEGTAERHQGAPVVRAARVARWLPGIIPARQETQAGAGAA